MLSVLIFIFPPLYGEGYDTISSLLNGQFSHIMDKSMFYSLNDTYWGLQIFLTLILLFKVFASSATNAGGGCGGIFAPSLYLGCIAGFVFAHASNYFPFTMYLSEKNFALLGMAGIMSGVMHAPLTGVFLIDPAGTDLQQRLARFPVDGRCQRRTAVRKGIEKVAGLGYGRTDDVCGRRYPGKNVPGYPQTRSQPLPAGSGRRRTGREPRRSGSVRHERPVRIAGKLFPCYHIYRQNGEFCQRST